MAGPAAGRVPATHYLRPPKKDVDGRNNPRIKSGDGQDDEEESQTSFLQPDFLNRTALGQARPRRKVKAASVQAKEKRR
jgi:hypothetical protein